jgi:hypothetical protein
MAPPDGTGYSVQTQALMRKAYYINEAATEFYKNAKPNCESAAISGALWPLVAFLGSAKSDYDDALRTITAAVDAADRGLRAIDIALQKVATSYMKAEHANTMGMKTDLPAPQAYSSPPASPSPSGISTAAYAGLNFGVDYAMVIGLGTALSGITAVSGAATIVELVNFTLVMTNVRVPFPFYGAEGHFNNVVTAVNNAKGNISDPNHQADFDKSWSGNAHDAFNTYMTNLTANQVPPLATTAGSLATACNSIAGGLVTFFFKIVAADLAAIGALLAANAAAAIPVVGEAAIVAAQWVIVGAWASFIATVVSSLFDMFSSAHQTLNDQKNQASNVAAAFFSDTAKLEDSKAAPTPSLVDTPHWNTEWVKK